MGEFYGSSYIVNPRGEIEAQASYDKDELLIHEIDLDMIRKVRDTGSSSVIAGRTPTARWCKADDRASTEKPAIQVGEFYELEVGADLASSSRFNEDIAPTRVAQRTWNEWHIAALWVGMAICVPTYTLGGVLTTYFGLSVGEALWAVFIANVIVLIP
jgi:hypothetical protein